MEILFPKLWFVITLAAKCISYTSHVKTIQDDTVNVYSSPNQKVSRIYSIITPIKKKPIPIKLATACETKLL
jgi:hypothetical protein